MLKKNRRRSESTRRFGATTKIVSLNQRAFYGCGYLQADDVMLQPQTSPSPMIVSPIFSVWAKWLNSSSDALIDLSVFLLTIESNWLKRFWTPKRIKNLGRSLSYLFAVRRIGNTFTPPKSLQLGFRNSDLPQLVFVYYVFLCTPLSPIIGQCP
jgi:hypothetical protein